MRNHKSQIFKVAYMFGGMNRGGAETIMLDLFQNHQMAPFSFIGIHRKGGAYRDAFYNAGPTLYQLAPKKLGYLCYLFKLRRLIKAEGITVVHAQHWLDCIYAWLATIGMHVQIVNTLHGFYPMNGINGWLCRMSIRMADDVCFVSKYEQEWYQRKMKIKDSKCHVIYNAVDFGKIDKVKNERVRELESERVKLCMVGNFVAERDHLTLVRALARLDAKHLEPSALESATLDVPLFDFYFIGKRMEAVPHVYEACVRVCEENEMTNVHFLGGRSDVPALLKQMDGFVYSTICDTFGIAIIEAMVAGLPIIVNDWQVMKEVCGESEDNYVKYFRSKDVEDCTDAIEKLLHDLSNPTADFQKRCAHNAQWVIGRYSIKEYFKRLLQIYNSHKI